MLLTGFAGQVPFWKFAMGTIMGATITLPLQLYTGYKLGHNNPTAVVGVAGISTFVIGVAVIVALVSWITLLWHQVERLLVMLRNHRQQQQQQQQQRKGHVD
jgi:membrane protein DedA with SNARE-associated domain